MIGGDVKGRLQQAVKRAIALNGHLSGSAATTGKSKAPGNWNNPNCDDTPMVCDAHLLDEVAVFQGIVPPILSARASELGYVCIRLPDAGEGSDALTGAWMAASAEFGDVSSRLRDALADGELTKAERADLLKEIDEAQAALATMRALASGEVSPVRAVEACN